jgi:hypothetical protein
MVDKQRMKVQVTASEYDIQGFLFDTFITVRLYESILLAIDFLMLNHVMSFSCYCLL